MMKVWQKIINLGVVDDLNPLRRKSIQLTNGITVITILMGCMFYPNLIRFLPDTISLCIILTLALLFYIPTFIFNKFHLYLFAKIYLLLTACINITVPSILLGKQQNFHFYLLTVIGIAFFIFEVKEKVYQFSVIILVSIVFICSELWLITHKGLISYPTEFLFLAELNDDLGLLIFVSGFYFYISYNYTKAELALGEEKKKLEEEQNKSESLLQNILPVLIATRLKENEYPIADGFESVTILFADIVGFTPLAEKMQPEKLIILLNEMFSKFDVLTEMHKLEKIKTIGDAYMVVGGLPKKDKDHALNVANFALEIRDFLSKYNSDFDQNLSIRIGIHTGPVVAGVIGIKKFSYDVWGNTVNIASRMESHGIPGKIQVSETTYKLLENRFVLTERGVLDIKGKGLMKTYLLEGMK